MAGEPSRDGACGGGAEAARKAITGMIHRVLDARTFAQAEAALGELMSHPLDMGLGKMLGEVVESALMYLLEYNRGLVRVAPEWCWRDFRLRLSRGRNQGSEERLERGALVWAIYRNFTPAQWRSERKRKYRRPGKSALEVAGVPPGRVSYLDALGI